MTIRWIQYEERVVGQGHPTLDDTINRPLRDLLIASGVQPDDIDDASFASGAALAAEIAARIAADALKQNIISAEDVVEVTGVIVSGATENGVVTLGKLSTLLKVVVTKFSRLRLYNTSAARAADASRPVGTDADPGSGLLYECVFDVTFGLTNTLSPVALLVNMDAIRVADIYYAIRNDEADSAITMTFTHAVLES